MTINIIDNRNYVTNNIKVEHKFSVDSFEEKKRFDFVKMVED